MTRTEELSAAFAALRHAIKTYELAPAQAAHKSMHALVAWETALTNAPQNTGWVRARRLELRTALNAFAPETAPSAPSGEVHRLYQAIVSMSQGQDERRRVRA